MIEVQNITKNYGPFQALKDISFQVDKGQIVGFLGPNGAGKTTTMRILTCFMPASSGRVTVAGYDVFKESREVRKRIGYLPENVPLYPEMTVTKYLTYMAKIRSVPQQYQRATGYRYRGMWAYRTPTPDYRATLSRFPTTRWLSTSTHSRTRCPNSR